MVSNQTKWIFAAGAMAVAVLLPEVALAQNNGQPEDTQNCTAPADPSQKGDRVPKDGEALSNKLENCNGVLKAPDSGDKGIVTPAPDTGNSRVIKPGDVPNNANPSNGSGG